MGNVVLRADTLSKRYTIAAEQPPYRTLRDDLTALFTWREKVRTAAPVPINSPASPSTIR